MKTGVVCAKAFSANGWRVDSSFHLSDSNVLYSLLDSCPYKQTTIEGIKKDCSFGNIFTRVFVKDAEHGVPYMTASDMVKADPLSGRFLSKKQVASLSNLILRKDWILISCSGTIGNVVYTNEQFDGVVATQDLIRLLPDETKTKGGLLYAYLASRYGYIMLTQSRFGGVVKHIKPFHVSQIPIPQFPAEFQERIDKQIKDAAALRVEANKLLEEAKRKVEEFVGGEPERRKSATVSSQRIFQSFGKRFEANYHISTGSELEDYIKDNFEYKLLGDVCKSISRPEIFKRNYVKNGVMFLGGADIMLATPDSGKYLSRKTPNIDALAVQEDWILIPRSGTIGDVVYTHSEHAQKLVSENVIRACPNNILSSGYIYAFLSSKVGKALIQRYIFGSVIQHVESPHLSRIPIPLMSEKEMTEIDSSIKKYKDNVGKAIRLERSAIKAVEDEIDSWVK